MDWSHNENLQELPTPDGAEAPQDFLIWQRRMRGALSQLPMASGPWIWRPEPAPGGDS
jgi:hypothetical protein